MWLRSKQKRQALKRQRGSASTEWTMGTLIMVFALFVPLPGADQSVMGLMMESLQGFHQHGSFLLSLP